MKLAVYVSAFGAQAGSCCPAARDLPSFDLCRAILDRRPGPVAAKLRELAARAEKAITRDAPDRYFRARQLEEAACYVAEALPGDVAFAELARTIVRLLHESFGSPEWRAPLIEGLRPGGL
jgi:hypothetical protein